MQKTASFQSVVSSPEDPRQQSKVLIPLDEALSLWLYGTISGCECFVDIAECESIRGPLQGVSRRFRRFPQPFPQILHRPRPRGLMPSQAGHLPGPSASVAQHEVGRITTPLPVRSATPGPFRGVSAAGGGAHAQGTPRKGPYGGGFRPQATDPASRTAKVPWIGA